MFRDVFLTDKEVFLAMAKRFYTSPAVSGLSPCFDVKNFETTFNLAMEGSPYVRILMIESYDGEPIGFAQLSFTFSMEVGGMVVLIEDVYIEESHRGSGYGRKLLGFLEKEFPTFSRFRLDVARDNEGAIRLFEQSGFWLFDYMQMVKDFEND